MKNRFLFFLILISFLSTNQNCVFAQNNNFNKILKVWNLIKNAKPIDKNSSVWKQSQNSNTINCISGDCNNGYGIYLYNGNQVEGEFKNSVPVFYVSTDINQYYGSASFDDIKIIREGKFYKIEKISIRGLEKRGFTLAEINYFHDLVYKDLIKCNCLTPTYDHPVGVNYVQTYEIVNGYNEHVRYENRDAFRYDFTDGLLNATNSIIYVRAYSKRRVAKYGVNNNPIEYFDSSFILQPKESMENGDFNYKPIDNGESINVEKLERLGYTNDSEELTKKGYSEYVKYVAQYTDKPTLVAECNQKQSTISSIAKSIGTNLYKVDAYTGRTNIKINAGDKIFIKATGKIKTSSDADYCDANGLDKTELFTRDQRMIKDFVLGSLLVSVGDCDWIQAGTEYNWVTECNGNLNIMINDCTPSSNTGSYTVEIKVVRRK